jgi:hypothetical protein
VSLDAVDAVNWSAIPNPTGHQCDDPERVAHALRRLTVSTTANETGDAASLLAGGGFVCDHAGMVFPAAYAATPILLDLHVPPFVQPAMTVRIEALTADSTGAACIQLTRTPLGIIPGSTLYAAGCGLREH